MTTARSPLRVLKAQAKQIAATLKAAERGDPIDARFAEKLADARLRNSFKAGIVMDDKVITIEFPSAIVRSSSQTALAEYILNLMREAAHAVH